MAQLAGMGSRIGEHDIEKNGRRSHDIPADFKIEAYDIWPKAGNQSIDLILKQRRVREYGWNEHLTIIIARFVLAQLERLWRDFNQEMADGKELLPGKIFAMKAILF
jgi:hypothetical protein